MPNVREILSSKDSQVHTVRPGATVQDAIRRMNDHGIGALIVVDDSGVVGMFTERDVLRRVLGADRSPIDVFIAEVMSDAVTSPTCATTWKTCGPS